MAAPAGLSPLQVREWPADPRLLAAFAGPEGTYFEGDGHALAGFGTAHRWLVPQADLRAGWADARQQLTRQADASGLPEVAFFALPFDRDEPAAVWIPADLGWLGPQGWLRTPERPAPDDVAALVRPSTQAWHWDLTPDQSPDRWCAAVRTAVDRIAAGAADKVVLARQITVRTTEPFRAAAVLARLRARFAHTYLYNFANLVGASPELLVGRDAGELFASPAAGTMPRLADPQADQRSRDTLLSSAKIRAEHQVLRDELLTAFHAACTDIALDPEPLVRSTPTVHHLTSPIRGVARADAPDLLTLAARLHPTSAVCGRPREAAYQVIRDLEPHGRGLYSGAVGWLDNAGNGRAVVAIRCVELSGDRATIHVGNGIVGDSDPYQELDETRDKLQGLVEAVVVP